VWIGGEVREPGKYRTSGQAHLRDAVYLAGGVTQDASLDSAQLFRTQPDGTMKILSVDLKEALAGNPVDNVVMQPRDRLLVHRNPSRVDPPTVFIKGEVAKPGRYPLTYKHARRRSGARSWRIEKECVCRKRRPGAFRNERFSEGAR